MDNKTILRGLWEYRMIIVGMIGGYIAGEFILNKYMNAIPLTVCLLAFVTIVAYIDLKICERVDKKKNA